MRRVLAALCGVVLAMFVSAAPARAEAGQLRNAQSHKCLTIAGGSTTPGAYAVQFPCDNHISRFWIVEGDLEDEFLLRNLNSGLCLGVTGSTINTVLTQQACTTSEVTWYRFGGTPWGVQLKNFHSGLCITPAGGSQDTNALIVQYYCDGHLSRGWYAA